MASDLDPRFSPAFQRGHEDDPVPLVERPVVERSRDPDPPLVERSRDPEPPLVEQSRDPDAPTLVRDSRRNPWLPVLWVLALGLVGFGVWAQWYAQKLYALQNFNSVEDYYITPNVLSNVSPWFIGVGLLALVGAVFIHAVRWER